MNCDKSPDLTERGVCTRYLDFRMMQIIIVTCYLYCQEQL